MFNHILLAILIPVICYGVLMTWVTVYFHDRMSDAERQRMELMERITELKKYIRDNGLI
jgi:hypothetical protein